MNLIPPYMQERHAVLQNVYKKITEDVNLIKKVFDFEKTVHADLELSWINVDFQKNVLNLKDDYQIIIATVGPMQVSKAHLHEIGASSFLVLGQKHGFHNPENLIFRTGKLEYPSGKVTFTHAQKCTEGAEFDIPPYTIHRFENKDNTPAHLLIVTHPIISVEKDHTDIHFAE